MNCALLFYLAYTFLNEINGLCKQFDQRVPGDVNPHLLILGSYDDHNVNATILVSYYGSIFIVMSHNYTFVEYFICIDDENRFSRNFMN